MDEHDSFFASLTRGTHVLGVALIGLGILSALAPGFTAAPVVILIGLLVVLAGIVRSVFAWRAWSAGKSPLGLLTGGLAVACGLALVFNPVSTVGAVSSLVALYMILDGGSGILFASDLGDDEERTWLRGDAWLSIALGVSMWVGWPLGLARARRADRDEARVGGGGRPAPRAWHAARRCGCRRVPLPAGRLSG